MAADRGALLLMLVYGHGRWVSHAQGLLTPFDRLEGFERRVHQPEANAEASAPGTTCVAFHANSDCWAVHLACPPMSTSVVKQGHMIH